MEDADTKVSFFGLRIFLLSAVYVCIHIPAFLQETQHSRVNSLNIFGGMIPWSLPFSWSQCSGT